MFLGPINAMPTFAGNWYRFLKALASSKVITLPMLLFLSRKDDLLVFLVCLGGPPPIRKLRSLNRILKELEPIVEKLEVRLLLAALMEVMIRINAKIPKAMIAIVIAVRNLFPAILRQDSDNVSLKVIR
jgi:hypothetical protein